jgi:UDP-glucose 4-epimerase
LIPLHGQRVVVTGASGFLGSHVVKRLVADGAVVHAFVRRAGGPRLAPVRDDVTEVIVDVTDPQATASAVAAAAPDIVVHFAGDTSARGSRQGWGAIERSLDVNLRGTLNVAQAAVEAGARVFLRAGGIEEYGAGPTPYVESQREQPVSPYSASQVAASHYLQMLQRTTETSLVTLRPALVYGPEQSLDFFIPALIARCLRGEDFEMTAGSQRRDLLYVDDLTDAFATAASTPLPPGAIVNLGHGIEHRMVDVADTIVRVAGGGRVLVGALPSTTGDLEHLVTSAELAGQLLGWRPKVSLEDGLRRTVNHYRQRVATEVAP